MLRYRVISTKGMPGDAVVLAFYIGKGDRQGARKREAEARKLESGDGIVGTSNDWMRRRA